MSPSADQGLRLDPGAAIQRCIAALSLRRATLRTAGLPNTCSRLSNPRQKVSACCRAALLPFSPALRACPPACLRCAAAACLPAQPRAPGAQVSAPPPQSAAVRPSPAPPVLSPSPSPLLAPPHAPPAAMHPLLRADGRHHRASALATRGCGGAVTALSSSDSGVHLQTATRTAAQGLPGGVDGCWEAALG